MDRYWSEQEVYVAGRSLKAPSDKFILYLKKFKDDELTTGTVERLQNYAQQREALTSVMRSLYLTESYRQIINNQHLMISNFWELFYILHYLTREIELTNNIGYHRTELAAGVYAITEWPYAEFTIIDTELREAVATSSSKKKDAHEASIIIEDRIIYVKLSDGKRYRISRKLRTNLAPHSFIEHVITHQRTRISRQDIKIVVGSSDITELVRSCGFNKSLKAIFFPNTTEQEAYFLPQLKLTNEQIGVLKKHKWNKARKGGTV